jgi:hypothetical protein
VHSGACDATRAAIGKPERPIVGVDALGERFAARLSGGHPGYSNSGSKRTGSLPGRLYA